MVAVLVGFGALISTAQASPEPAWVHIAASTMRAKSALSKPRTAESRTSGVDRTAKERRKRITNDVQSDVDPVVKEMWEASAKPIEETVVFMRENRPEKAFRVIDAFAHRRPDCWPFAKGWHIQCALLTGRYDLAYAESLAVVRDDPAWSDRSYLWLSLACAAKGDVYPGQAEYCAERILSHGNAGARPAQGPWALSPHGQQGAKRVMVDSCIALGLQGEAPFWELALRLDPSNEFAARQAVQFYEVNGRYSDVRRICSTKATHVPPDSREFYERSLADAKGKADRPFPVDKSDTPEP